MTKTFKHSGTLGDIIQSLALMKSFGGGEFYLHLNQVEWIASYYYGNKPDPYHNGKMNLNDFEFMKDFMNAQEYVTKFDVLTDDVEITHNLDRFRPLFVGHPANYVTTYCLAFGIVDKETQDQITKGPWITCPNPRSLDKPYVINRTGRFTSPGCHEQWKIWKEEGMDKESVFVGLEKEYQEFKQLTGWDLEHYPTKTMLDLAEVIAGSKKFVGNQSVALSIAQGLGVEYVFEARKDLPIERNENYYSNHPHGSYF